MPPGAVHTNTSRIHKARRRFQARQERQPTANLGSKSRLVEEGMRVLDGDEKDQIDNKLKKSYNIRMTRHLLMGSSAIWP
jgi:hypothetical protein